jgi:beta-galactosidase
VDTQPITLRSLDAEGRPVPTANLPAVFTIEGPGTIIGLGNGNPNSHEPEKGDRRSLFNGLAQIIVQSTPGATGAIVLRATADGLRAAELRIAIDSVPPIPAVPAPEPVQFLQAWHSSPLSNERIDPNIVVADNDMNTWPSAQPGELQSFAAGKFALYRTKFEPFQSIQRDGGRVHFKSVTGKAEVWIDGRRIAKRDAYGPGAVGADIPPGNGLRQLTLLIETEPGKPAGIDGSIHVAALDS